MSMVQFEPVSEEEELMRRVHHQGGDLLFKGRVELTGDMTRFDAERLLQLIANHERYTGSTVASKILDNWAEYRGKFVKVMPVEYRRALAEMEKAKRELAPAE
jgi:glutamate synthase (NADPH/NADH) large chain